MNAYFTWMFTFEMVIKIAALGGITNYVKDGFNVFDAVLVVISLFDVAISQLNFQSGPDTSGSQVFTAFRTLRVVRVFKLAKRSENLLTLFKAISKTLKDIFYFSCLLFLYIFICALLGMEYFAYEIK